jgi:hypothetical protein
MHSRPIPALHKTDDGSVYDPCRPRLDKRAVVIGILLLLVLGISAWLLHNHTVQANKAASHVLIPSTNKR